MTAQPCGVQHEDNVKKNPRIFYMRSSNSPRHTGAAGGDCCCRHRPSAGSSLEDDAIQATAHLRLTQAEGTGD
jgi:hypothetical protein